MAKSDLQKLKRAELLEMLVEQMERADRLEKDLSDLQKRYEERERMVRQAGDLAKALAIFLKKLDQAPMIINLGRNEKFGNHQGRLVIRKKSKS